MKDQKEIEENKESNTMTDFSTFAIVILTIGYFILEISL